MRTHDRDIQPAPRAHTRSASASHVDSPDWSPTQRVGRLDTRAVLSLQRTAGNAVVAQLLEDEEQRSPVHEVVESRGGDALDETTRTDMEARFGADLSDVRVHRDPRASESARSVAAEAYTVGSNIVFASGSYDPASHRGKHLLAHELTHVVQQRAGPVSGTPAPGGILVSDPSDAFEQEAERTAERVTRDAPATETAPPASTPAAVQREKSDDEDEDVAKR
jgi:hypothetical protein